MLAKIRTVITASQVYFGILFLMLVFFTWSEFTGNRLIGDDNYETEKHGYGTGTGGRGYHRGRSSFYHK